MSVRLTVVAAVVVALASAAHATPSQELEKARDEFRDGHFAEAIPALNYLLYPTARLSQPEDLLEARVLLAVCLFESGDRDKATDEFNTVLEEDLDYSLNTLLFSKEVVKYFDGLKRAAKDKAKKDADARRKAEDAALVQAALDAMVVYETRPYYINFIPFGAGQFQNDDRRKGLFFAATEGVTGGLSAGIWIYLVTEFGLPGKVAPERVNGARLLQQIEIGAGGVCLGLMAWGIVDSLLHYEPSVRQAADPSMLPPDLRKKLDTTTSSSLRLAPEVLPGGGGLSLTGEF